MYLFEILAIKKFIKITGKKIQVKTIIIHYKAFKPSKSNVISPSTEFIVCIRYSPKLLLFVVDLTYIIDN